MPITFYPPATTPPESVPAPGPVCAAHAPKPAPPASPAGATSASPTGPAPRSPSASSARTPDYWPACSHASGTHARNSHPRIPPPPNLQSVKVLPRPSRCVGKSYSRRKLLGKPHRFFVSRIVSNMFDATIFGDSIQAKIGKPKFLVERFVPRIVGRGIVSFDGIAHGLNPEFFERSQPELQVPKERWPNKVILTLMRSPSTIPPMVTTNCETTLANERCDSSNGWC